MTTTAVFDLTLDTDANGYRLRMHFVPPDGSAARDAETPVAFDFAALRALELNAAVYGKTLYRQLLADGKAEIFFRECRAAAGSAPLRLRVCLRPEVQDLHRLHWETLRDDKGKSLTTGDQVWFSRYLFSDQARPAALRPRVDLRALVAIANPAGHGLSPVDVPTERERILKAWGDDKSITVLDGVTGERATLNNLARHLRDGYDVLYIVVHGKFNQDESESALWLEDDAGNVAKVKGEELLGQLTEIAQWPGLIALLSCQSAHADETHALLSLGPRLSAKGIPAVLAMQGQVSMATGAAFMPEFFRELRQHGQIDQACAVARSVVRKETDAWMPALFLRTESGRLWEEDTTAPAPGIAPYKGLAAFTEADAAHFFGRADEIQKLKTRLELIAANPGPTGRFLAVVGASGSGKSSLVQAGLIPALKETGQWAIAPVYRPQALNTQLDALDGLISTWRTANLQAPNILLVVDQFEEIFTLEASAQQRERFIQQLLQLAQQPGPVCVVLTLRSDFFTACLQHADLRLALENRQFLLGAMTRAALTQAITRPVEQGQWAFEPGLVDVILDDVGNEPGNLPLLSQALLETWHKRAGRRLTLKGYIDAGGVEKALANRAQAVYDSLTSVQRPIARHIFVQLTHLGEGQQDTRRRVRVSQLPTQSYALTEVQIVLKALADARLLVTDQPQNETDTVAEVAHEALIRAWPNLRAWLNEDREAERLRRRLEDDAEAWLKANQDPGLLYRAGVKLEQAKEWLTTYSERKTRVIHDFVQAGHMETTREALERDQRRQKELHDMRLQRWLASGVAVFALAFAVALYSFLTTNYGFDPMLYLTGRSQVEQQNPFIPLPGGNYMFGVEVPNLSLGEFPTKTVFIQAFQINQTEVTNGQYRICRRAGGCKSDPRVISDYQDLSKDDYPVVYVNAIQANEFCQWLPGDLPDIYQWEYAARGLERRLWPWGNQPFDSSRPQANFYPSEALTATGRYPSGATLNEGILDLSGNVAEWTKSLLAEQGDGYEIMLGQWDGEQRDITLSLRGGSWRTNAVEPTQGSPRSPEFSDDHVGFRCVQDISE